jgi:hypothetical protein
MGNSAVLRLCFQKHLPTRKIAMRNILLLLFAVAAVVAATPEAKGDEADSVVEVTETVAGVAAGVAGSAGLPGRGIPEAFKIIGAVVVAVIAIIVLVKAILFLVNICKNKEPDMDSDDGVGTVDDNGLENKLTQRIDELAYRIDDLSGKVTTIMNMLRGGSGVQRGVAGVPVPSAMPAPLPSPVVERPKEIFYFANPVPGGVFKVEKAKQSPDDSLYRFERFVGEGKARIFVIDELRVVRRFTERPEAQDGVCDDGGNFNYDAKRIEVSPGNEGVAVLEGDSWRVTQKVKIKYIM